MEWNLAINRNRFIRAGNSEAVGRIRVELARRTRAILPSYPLPSVLLSLPFAKKSSCCVSECVRARLRARACVSEIPKTLPTLCFILLLLLLLLLFFFSFFCPCRRYSRSLSPFLARSSFFPLADPLAGSERSSSPAAINLFRDELFRSSGRLRKNTASRFVESVTCCLRSPEWRNRPSSSPSSSSPSSRQKSKVSPTPLSFSFPSHFTVVSTLDIGKGGRKESCVCVFPRIYFFWNVRRFAAEAAERRWNSSVDQSKRGLRFSAYDARAAGLRVEGTLRKIRKAYPHERGLVKETCACLVLLPLQLMSTHSQLIRTVCIDYCIPLVAPRIGFTVKARPNEPPRRKKPELDVPIRPPELWIPDVFSSFARRLRVRRNARGAREPIPVLFTPV